MQGAGRCGGCGAEFEPAARFCGQCAAPVGEGDAASQERRQITVLFSDLSGYTEMAEDLDPEVVRELMAAVYAEAETIVRRHGGRVDKLMGDAVLAVFGDPVAHEDDAQRAVRAALDLHAAVEAMAPSFEAAAGRAVSMHSGINTGVVVTGDRADVRSGPLGDMVNVAARLQSLAGEGEILVGPETQSLLSGRVPLTDLGEQPLKGRREPVRVARVERSSVGGATPSRRVSDFIGREDEVGVLVSAVERLRDGERSLVTICAEAGAGKSRLLEELRSRLAPDVQWLEGRAYPYTANIPHAPIIDLLNRAAGIDERDHAEAVAAKLTAMVERTLPGHGRAVSTLGQLYELVPPTDTVDLEAFRSHLLDVMRDLIDAVARRAPTVLCLQDLHWVDPSTADLVRDLAATGHEPIVTVCNFRPGFVLGATGERAIDLSVLSPIQTRRQLVSLLDGIEPPDDLVDAVVERTDGNPFFVEEIVNRLLETELLVRGDDGWQLQRSLDDVGIPGTIRGVIAARIDGLDADRRRVLREASVVGRAFLHRLVHEVTDRPDGLDESLGRLVGADLIREHAIDPELEYAFKHALTQEVAYDGLLLRERQELHERVARAIESSLADRAGELAETLAYHWERSGHVVPAVTYLQRSGRKALDRYALAEAERHYRSAYTLLTAELGSGTGVGTAGVLDRLLLELILDWAQVHYYQGRFGDLHRLLTDHAALPTGVGDDALHARWLAWSGLLVQGVLGDCNEAIRLLESARQLGERCGDVTAVAYALAWLPWALWPAGRSGEVAAQWAELQTLLSEVPDPHDRRYVLIKGMGGAATAAAALGRTRAARELAADLLALGNEIGNRRAVTMAKLAMLVVNVTCGDLDAAFVTADEATADEADPVYRHLAHVWSAGIDAMLGDAQRAKRTTAENYEECVTLGLGLYAAYHDVCAALVAMADGQLSRGARDLASCRELAVRAGNRWMEVAIIDNSLAVVHARMATGEVSGSALDALRNPSFVLGHARGAAKRGRRELESLLTALDEADSGCFKPMVQWELAKLARHEGRDEDARRHAEAVVALLVDDPDAELVHHAEALLAAV